MRSMDDKTMNSGESEAAGRETGEFMRQAKKLTDWTKEPEVAQLKEDLLQSREAYDTHKTNVERWRQIRNVTGKAKPPKVQGRSSIQPKLVRRQNEWRYSALSEPFLSAKKLFSVDPHTFEDGESATQNELLLNWQFRTKVRRVKFIDEYVRTAVDEGSVIVRLGWRRETAQEMIQVPIFELYEMQSQEEMGPLEEAIQLKIQDPGAFLDIAPELQEAAGYYEETGMPVVAAIVGMEETPSERILFNQPTVQIVDPANLYVDPACEGDIEKAGYVICSFETSKAELLKDGRYENLDVVNWSANSVLSEPDHHTQTPGTYAARDDLRKPVVAYEYWGELDIEGNETLTPVVCTWIGDTMIRCEKNPFPDGKPPFVVADYMPVNRSLFGEPDAELLEDNQKVLGALMRGMIDLMARSANSQQGMAKGFLDVTNRKRFQDGKDYEYNPGAGDPRLSVYQHTYPEIPGSAMNMVQLQNYEAESLSGVKAFSGGMSGDAFGDVAAGIKGMLDAAALREMGIIRRLADGLTQIGVKIAAMNSVFLSEEEVVRVTNREFVTVKREDLAGNFDLIVDIATEAVDEKKAQDLGFMLQTMGPDMDPAMVRLILSEISELKRMPVLAEQIRNYEPPVDEVAEELKKLEIAKIKAEIAKIESETMENQAQAAEKQAKTQQVSMDTEREISGENHARAMSKIQAQNEAGQDLTVTKALLESRKPDETAPDIAAAIGYNRLTKGAGL